MDSIRAKRIVKELKGKKVGGWSVLDYINHGKSSVVIKAKRNNEFVAIKIFDPELIERFGRETQLERIEREKSLIGKKHPHLIEIKDGGACPETGYLFIAMEYLPYQNLSQVLSLVPRENIFPIIKQVASAAKYLEDLSIVHRDIKPENIAISDDFLYSKLMDLGVIRPIKLSELTDQDDEIYFVGTLRYSSPELLYRIEEHSIEGWRAVTFYQLGAVLHDMIMRKPIFEDYRQPYANLVNAVTKIKPFISANDVDSNIISLARTCLVKEPAIRVKYVKWESFLALPSKKQSISDIKDRIMKRHIILGNNKSDKLKTEDDHLFEQNKKLQYFIDYIDSMIRSTCIDNSDCFPQFKLFRHIDLKSKNASILICLGPSIKHHFNVTLSLSVLVSLLDENDEIINISIVALLSKDIVQQDAFEAYEYTTLYIGPFDDKIVSSKISFLMWLLIDMAQENIYNSFDKINKDQNKPVQILMNLNELNEDIL